MVDKKQPCAHPDICPAQGGFAARVKTEKLALEPPPPSGLVPRPPRQAKSASAEADNE